MKLCMILCIVGLASIAAKKYHVSRSTSTFLQAYVACKRYGFTLATEESAIDTENIKNAIIEATHTTDTHYIGGYRQNTGDFVAEWIWLEGGKPLNYTNWYKDSDSHECLIKIGDYVDDSDDGNFENAATDNPLLYTGKWTSDCDKSYYFICQSE